MEKKRKQTLCFLFLSFEFELINTIRFKTSNNIFWSRTVVLWEFYMFKKHKGYFEHQEIHIKNSIIFCCSIGYTSILYS